jgi:hypothetical protein
MERERQNCYPTCTFPNVLTETECASDHQTQTLKAYNGSGGEVPCIIDVDILWR